MNLAVKSVIVMLVFAALFIAIPTASAQQQQADSRLDAKDYQTMKEDLEIMRRIFEKTLDSYMGKEMARNAERLGLFPGQEDEDRSALANYKLATDSYRRSFFTTGSGRFNTESFYVPGSGAVFTMAISIPAREVDPQETDAPPQDLWQETEQEIRQGNVLQLFKEEKEKTWSLDGESMETILDRLIEAAARNCGNMEQLGSGDLITLIVKFTGRRPLDTLASVKGDVALSVYSFWSGNEVIGLSEDVIVQIPVAYLTRYLQSNDFEAFKKSLRILRYPGKGAKAKNDRFF
ncbi:MAG: hypothetical protein KJ645_04940 [Planctomycetes bacterium]|nr:hypothetical protein [Planctomycetota bacterium]